MSTINVNCIDQTLTITNAPVIAAGGVNEDFISFTFSNQWNGYDKTAVFYRGKAIFYSIIQNNQCVIPAGALSEKGMLYISVFGKNGFATRTSEVMPYEIVDGAITVVPEPPENVYDQIRASISTLEDEVEGKQDELTFDTIPTANSMNPVTSGGVYTALTENPPSITFDQTPTYGSQNAVTSNGIASALEGKLDAVMQTRPVQNDYRPIASGGVYDYLMSNEPPTYYVDSSSTAGWEDGSYGFPFLTIQAAIDMVSPVVGAVIRIAEGLYEELHLINKQNVTLTRYDDGDPRYGVVTIGMLEIVGSVNIQLTELAFSKEYGQPLRIYLSFGVYLDNCSAYSSSDAYEGVIKCVGSQVRCHHLGISGTMQYGLSAEEGSVVYTRFLQDIPATIPYAFRAWGSIVMSDILVSAFISEGGRVFSGTQTP